MSRTDTAGRTAKPWGWTTPIYTGGDMHSDFIEVARGGYCSIHSHESKVNIFYVREGELYVRQFTPDGQRLTCKHLLPGQTVAVAAGIWHQFWAIGAAKALEVYFPFGGVCDRADIKRHIGLPVGGIEHSFDALCRKWQLAFGAQELCTSK